MDKDIRWQFSQFDSAESARELPPWQLRHTKNNLNEIPPGQSDLTRMMMIVMMMI